MGRIGQRALALSTAPLFALALGCSGAEGDGDGAGGGADTGPTGGPVAGVGSSGTGSGQSMACAVAAEGLAVSNGLGTTPSLLWDGKDYVIAYTSRGKDEGDIIVARLDKTGARISESVIEDGPAVSTLPVLVKNGAGFFTVWQNQAGTGSVVRGRYLDASGKPSGPAFDIAQSTAAEARPTAAMTPAGIAVAWADGQKTALGLVEGQTTTSTSEVAAGLFPSLAAEGDRAGIAFSQGSLLQFAKIESGKSSAPTPVREGGGEVLISKLRYGAGGFTVAWEDLRSGEEDIFVSRIDDAGNVFPETRVPSEPGSANWPDIAFTDNHIAVAYYQFRDGPPGIYLAMLTPSLERVSVDLLVSGDRPSRFPSIGWTGQELGIAYAEKDGGVYFARVACP